MQATISSQVYIFLYSVAGGALIAFMYDVFRIKRKAIKTGVFIIQLEDLIFWLLVAFVVFGVLYYSNEGEIRGFIFIGTVLGAVLYMLVLSRVIMSISMFALKIIYRIVKAIWKVISYPFMLLFKILKLPVVFMAKLIKGGIKKIRQKNRIRKTRVGIWRRIFRNAKKKI